MMKYVIERQIGFAPLATIYVYKNSMKFDHSDHISSLQTHLKLGNLKQRYMGRIVDRECSVIIFYSHLRHVPSLTKIENDLTWLYEYYPQLKMTKPHNQNIIIDSEQLWKNLQK